MFRDMSSGSKREHGKIVLAIFSSAMFIFMILPSLIAIPMSFTNTKFLVFPPQGFTLGWYQNFITDENWMGPAFLSLRVAILTALISVCLGTMTSLALVRGTLPFKKTLNIFLISPMMIPVIIIAFAVYGLYAKLHLIGSLIGVVLGHTIIAVPFVILIVNASLFRFDINLERAARNLGASPLKTFWLITLPLIKPGMVSAAVFSFITSMDELVLSMFLIGSKQKTLPMKIFSQIQWVIDPVVAAASTFFIAVSIAIVIISVFIRRDATKHGNKEQRDEFS
jgi:ABC-type spermidine/putrescine transport system permease subunit II